VVEVRAQRLSWGASEGSLETPGAAQSLLAGEAAAVEEVPDELLPGELPAVLLLERLSVR